MPASQLLKDCSAHCGGAHACVASKYDSVKSSEVNFAAVSGCSVSAALGSCLHVAHLALRVLKARSGVGHLHDGRSDQEGNSGTDQEADDDHELSASGSNCQHSARMEPGDAGLTRPTLKMVLKNIAATEPPMVARSSRGFIRT